MFSMFRQFFTMFTRLFSAGEKLANSLDILAGIGESMAQDFATTSSIERQRQRLVAEKELKALTK